MAMPFASQYQIIDMSSSIQSVFSHLLHTLDPDDYALLPHDVLPVGTAYIPGPSPISIPTSAPSSSRTIPPTPAPTPSSADGSEPVTFVNGKQGKPNAIWRGHRYCLVRRRDERSYWKCTLFRDGYKGKLNLLNNSTVTNVPAHTGHAEQHVEIAVHTAKQSMKRKAADSDHTPNLLSSSPPPAARS